MPKRALAVAGARLKRSPPVVDMAIREAMSEGDLKQMLLAQRPALIRYLRARGISPDDAEDILQDLYLKLDPPPDNVDEPRAYLYRMAHNLMEDRRRSAARRARRDEQWTTGGTGVISEVDDRPSAEEMLISRDRLTRMSAVLATLPNRTRDIFRRFRIEAQTQKAIADDLGISKSAVEKHLYRAYHVVAEAKARLDAGSGDATSARGARHSGMDHDHDS